MAFARDQDSKIFVKSGEPRVDFQCSECGGRLSVKASMAGSRGKCPVCGDAVEATVSRRETLAVNAVGASDGVFNANRIIASAAGYGTDDSWRQRYDRQKRKWMRRRSIEKRIEQIGEVLLVNRGRLMGVLAIGMITVGLFAFGMIAGR
jgi:hypothetical protein